MKSNTLNKDFLMIAKTMHGLEDVLAEELKAIGAKNIKKGKRAIEFYGNQETLYKSNICLRTALRILKPISTFNIKDQVDLYNEVKKISTYYNIDSLLSSQIIILSNSNNLKKEVMWNSISEKSNFSPLNFDWKKELNVFNQIDINQPSNKSAYEIS